MGPFLAPSRSVCYRNDHPELESQSWECCIWEQRHNASKRCTEERKLPQLGIGLFRCLDATYSWLYWEVAATSSTFERFEICVATRYCLVNELLTLLIRLIRVPTLVVTVDICPSLVNLLPVPPETLRVGPERPSWNRRYLAH